MPSKCPGSALVGKLGAGWVTITTVLASAQHLSIFKLRLYFLPHLKCTTIPWHDQRSDADPLLHMSRLRIRGSNRHKQGHGTKWSLNENKAFKDYSNRERSTQNMKTQMLLLPFLREQLSPVTTNRRLAGTPKFFRDFKRLLVTKDYSSKAQASSTQPLMISPTPTALSPCPGFGTGDRQGCAQCFIGDSFY